MVPKIVLNDEQRGIVHDFVHQGRNVFMTGVAGTGKTTTITEVVHEAARAKLTCGITAMTGSAAILIGGQTLHSYLGIGLAKGTACELARNVRKVPSCYKLLRRLDALIIDEVSMMDAELLEKVSEYLGILRDREETPFGGVRVLLSGDMCQLPPVKGTYCFKTPLWETAGLVMHVLRHVYRQDGDARFLELLENARWGRLNDEDIELLEAAKHTVFPVDSDIVPTRLYSLLRDVNRENDTHFKDLVEKTNPELVTYTAVFGGRGASPATVKGARVWFEKSKHETEIVLCAGAQVMCTWNLKQDGLMNGTRGIVVRCRSRSVEMRLLSGAVVEIGYQTISPMDAPELEARFMPLRLAWAVSIHKSQGMTIDCMEADLGKSVFEYGQAYTALSRARNLAGVRLIGFNPRSFKTHPDVLAFYGHGNTQKQ